MPRLILRRLALILPTFIGVTLMGFALIHAVPGDPVEVRTGEHGISPERLAYYRHELGPDQPLWKQFVNYEVQLLHGDLGKSVMTQQSVWSEFTTVFPATLELATCALIFAIVVGLPLGVVAAVRTSRLRRVRLCCMDRREGRNGPSPTEVMRYGRSSGVPTLTCGSELGQRRQPR